MLVLLTSKWRQRAAAVLVAVYALCLLAPAVAFAFSDAAAHCLTVAEAPQTMGEHQGHQHDGMDHTAIALEAVDHGTPASGGNDHALPGQCCGLFCVSALMPPVFGVDGTQSIEVSAVAMPAASSLMGRSSSRLDRPPRNLSAI